MTYKVIGAIGDSITNGYWDEDGLGWFGKLSQKIAKNFPMQFGFNNMSQDGDRTCDTYHRVASEVHTRDIDILLIAIGTNDLIRSPEANSPMDMSKHLREEYWHKMLDLLEKTKITPVVLDLLPKREEMYPSLGWFDKPCFETNKDVEEYNEQIKSICKQRNIAFINRYDKWIKRDLKDYYKDGGHPNSKGHQLIADEVYEELINLEIL